MTGDAVPKDVDKLNGESEDEMSSGNSTLATVSSSTTMSDLVDKTDVYARQSVTTSTSTVASRSKPRLRKYRIRPVVVSMLEITTVMPDDAGTYTCAPSNAKNHSVVVHVIQGKYFAFVI